MTGFLIGSLNKIWPWRKITDVGIKHVGTPKEEIFIKQDTSVLPTEYVTSPLDSLELTYTVTDPQLMKAVLLALAGLAVIGLLELIAKRLKRS